MKSILDTQLLPKIQASFQLPYILHKTLHTYGVGESEIALRLVDFEAALPEDIKLAYLPKLGSVRLRLSAKGTDKASLTARMEAQLETLTTLLRDIVGNNITDEQGIEQHLITIFKKHKLTLATAESCTLGKLGQRFLSVPGASQYFKSCFVPYDTQMKVKVLGVDKNLIATRSVVSKEVAGAMALRAKSLFEVDFAVATTGNAGPSKGDSDAEVGTICIAVAAPGRLYVEEFKFSKHREKNIEKTINKALELLHKALETTLTLSNEKNK